MKTIQGKITISRVSCNMADDYMEIRLRDETSNITFAEVQMSLHDFALAVTGMGHVECTIEVRGLEDVGKRWECQERFIDCPLRQYDRKVLSEWLAEHGKVEGWHVNTHLGSRGDVTPFDGGQRLRYTIYRYVDEEGK